MRWKLASGGTVGTTKQPVRKKDFDRLVIDYIEGDTTSLTDWSIKLINPSTHMMRKFHNGEVYISITPEGRAWWKGRLLHLPYNYCSLSDNDDLTYGINDISNFDPSGFQRDGLKWLNNDQSGITKGGNKATLDRLIYPENYDEFFNPSAINEDGPFYSEHTCSDKWRAGVIDKVKVILWKGYPHREHGTHQLTNMVSVDVNKTYLLDSEE